AVVLDVGPAAHPDGAGIPPEDSPIPDCDEGLQPYVPNDRGVFRQAGGVGDIRGHAPKGTQDHGGWSPFVSFRKVYLHFSPLYIHEIINDCRGENVPAAAAGLCFRDLDFPKESCYDKPKFRRASALAPSAGFVERAGWRCIFVKGGMLYVP